MLHTKYQSCGPSGFREEDFLVFPIVSLWDLSVAMETTILIQSAPKPNTINPPTQLWFTLNLIKIGLLASEIFFFEIVEGRTTDGRRRTTDACLSVRVAGQLGPKTTRTLGIFRTQDESDPSLRQLGPKPETTRTQQQGRPCKKFLFYYVLKTCIKHTHLLKS